MNGKHNPDCSSCICFTCKHDRDCQPGRRLCCSEHEIRCDEYNTCPDYEADDVPCIVKTEDDCCWHEYCGGCGEELQWHNDFLYCPYCGASLGGETDGA